MTSSPNLHGAALMVAGMTSFTLSDACMKALGTAMPLSQSLLLRGAAVTLILALVLGRALAEPVGRRDWGIMLLRAAAEAGAAWFFFLALARMPLANLSAVMQASPLAITLAAWPVLGQRVGAGRLLAILGGLAGVLLIVRPGAEGWGWPVCQALGSVACVTVRDLASRGLGPKVPTPLVVLVTGAGVALSGALVAPFQGGWVALDGRAALLLAATTVFVMGGYGGITAAMRRGEVSFVAPFRYAGLLVAIVVGVAAFGTFPDSPTLLGAGVVVATGLFTLLREARRPRPEEEAAPGV
ncbi:Membrane protein, putative [Rubellimicrobium mesophilum DSM 19309]|uniref:Membrane protein, putative n=1 Tax=Rubellimicrobium mesophilum DSM 19309 TaxID=442562 RepID=A0A017HR44_9RHOB|nr:DMT family transporter [Rubellimicrobium mesophilum]EYD76851.1 Membrane protein, putative [Rubellimicrobium mesophilum DSM 19309]